MRSFWEKYQKNIIYLINSLEYPNNFVIYQNCFERGAPMYDVTSFTLSTRHNNNESSRLFNRFDF